MTPHPKYRTWQAIAHAVMNSDLLMVLRGGADCFTTHSVLPLHRSAFSCHVW